MPWHSEAITVQTKCGKYFGYNTYPGVAERCISFSYESGTAVFIRTVAISTLKLTIDNSLEDPMVKFKSQNEILLRIPPTMYFQLEGQLPDGVTAKDIILHVIGEIGSDGATYRAMEFAGEGIYSLNMDERMTICNMAIEAGGKSGIIAADDVTLDYVRSRHTAC